MHVSARDRDELVKECWKLLLANATSICALSLRRLVVTAWVGRDTMMSLWFQVQQWSGGREIPEFVTVNMLRCNTATMLHLRRRKLPSCDLHHHALDSRSEFSIYQHKE